MYQTLKYSIDSLIQQLREQGTHSETILNYRIVCNCVLNFYEAEPHSEKEDSLSAFLGRYRSGTEKALENGEISKGYAVFKKRVLRLLGDHAENGWADIKVAPRNRIYSPNELHQEVIIWILDANNLMSSSGYVLAPPIRHFFCFIESRGLSIENISNNVFLDFLEEVSESNRGSMGRTFRALKLACVLLILGSSSSRT